MFRSQTFKYLSKRIYDLSPPIGSPIPYYPGDAIFRAQPICTIETSGCNMHLLEMGTHTGSHVDAPLHFLKEGKSVDQIPLDRFMAEVEVLEVRSKEIGPEHLGQISGEIEGVLFKTINSDFMSIGFFWRDYVHLTLEAAEKAIEQGLKIIGIDYVSIERFGTRDFSVHKKLLEAGIILLEGLNLKDVPPGKYILFAFPLRLKGMDGAPVRAVLVEP